MSRIERTEGETAVLREGEFQFAVDTEMRCQDRHWGAAIAANHDWITWIFILGQEYTEALDAVGPLTWFKDSPIEVTNEKLYALRVELIQMAAVAAQIITVIDNNIWNSTHAHSVEK